MPSKLVGFYADFSLDLMGAACDVEMLLTADLNPLDLHCIYSTLVYVIDQARKMYI